ncbi:MAG: hypothetical protein Q9209_007008 [Squamulea sp. 1 TL-2023]
MGTISQDPRPNATDRIAQLSEIDRVDQIGSDVAQLLEAAGLAIKTLTHTDTEADGQNDKLSQTIEQRKESFTTASSRYFSLLSSIDVRLRRHISALESAEIIPPETGIKESQNSKEAPTATTSMSTSSLPRPNVTSKDVVTNGGLGNLDIGWLNSRNNNVEKAMEAELWQEAHELIETTLKGKDRGNSAMSDDAAAVSSGQP